jgi:hypothetical protein
MVDFKKLLRAFLAKVLKKSDGDIDAILDASNGTEDSVLAELLDLDKTRVSELTKPKDGQTFQDGYKKAKKEVLSTLEQELKDKYEIESDATGIELVDAIVTTKAKTGKKELTEDDVKKHPVYQQAETAHKKALKEANTQWEAKLNEQTTQYKKGETFNVIKSKALEIRNAMQPVIPGNPKVASNVEAAFISSLNGFEYDLQDNGARIVIMKDGKVVDDGHGHSLDFEKHVKDSAAGYYEFKQNNGGGNAGNGEQGGGSGAGGAGGTSGGVKYPDGITKPKTYEDLMKIVNNQEIKAQDRSTVLQVWEAEQKTGGGTS